MPWRFRWMWCLAGLLLAGPASAQLPRPQHKVVAWEAPETAQTICYGVLGEVARPAVYTSPLQAVTVQDLIRQAGGLTPHAGTTVRIIRQGRPAQALFFTPDGRDAVQPSDVVIVDAISAARSGFGSTVVWMALVGVIDRPVIVPVRPELAQLNRVTVDMLSQTRELVPLVRVIRPPRTPDITSPDAALPSGSVLIFDRSLLVEKNLPAFPLPVAFSTESAASIPAPIVEPVPPPPSADPPWSAALTSQPQGPVNAIPVPFPTLPDEAPPTRTTSLPAPGSRFHVPPVPQPPLTVPADVEAVDPKLAADESVEILPAPAPPTEAAAKPQAPLTLWPMLGISGTVACLIGIAIATRKYVDSGKTKSDTIEAARKAARAVQPPQRSASLDVRADISAAAPAPASSVSAQPVTRSAIVPTQERAGEPLETDDLAEILSGQLTIISEPIEFPKHVALQRHRGHAAGLWRLDAQSSLPAPHHVPAPPPRERAVAIDPAVASVPKPHFLGVASRPAAPAKVPAATGSAVERALAQLQGGHS